MIRLEWRPLLTPAEAAEVAALLDEAATYDEEAGFSTARPGGSDWHLLIRMGPRGSRGRKELELIPDAALVAYLQVDAAEADCLRAQLVVHPQLRSLGVGTLTVERILGGESWPGESARDVQVWSHGSHPAAERMSKRFGASVVAALAKTVCYLPELESATDTRVYSQLEASGDDLLPGHKQGVAPAERLLMDRSGLAHLDPDGGGVVISLDAQDPAYLRVLRTPLQNGADLTRLLRHGGTVAREAGARLAVLYLDAMDEELVHAALSVGFVHEHSDLRYDLARASV